MENQKEINNVLDKIEDTNVISHLTQIMADDYEISDENRCIEDIINSYTKERMINRRNEILEKLEQKDYTNEEMASLEKELNDIILKLARMK